MKVLGQPRVAIRIVLAAILAICALWAIPATASAASEDGFIRLAHLSPDTPSVDVYLDSRTANGPEKVFHGVTYGTVSDYLTLPPGRYIVAMRLSGASPETKPAVTTDVSVAPGRAYTVAGVGKFADLGLAIITDDFSDPLDGQAMVRIVQASINVPLLDVSIQGEGTVATAVRFATTTTYRTVTPGKVTLEVGAAGGTTVPLTVTLKPGGVYSVLVLDDNAKLVAQLRIDAQSQGKTPAGGIATGGGGMSRAGLINPMSYVAVGALLLALLLLLRRGPRARWTARPTRSL